MQCILHRPEEKWPAFKNLCTSHNCAYSFKKCGRITATDMHLKFKYKLMETLQISWKHLQLHNKSIVVCENTLGVPETRLLNLGGWRELKWEHEICVSEWSLFNIYALIEPDRENIKKHKLWNDLIYYWGLRKYKNDSVP